MTDDRETWYRVPHSAEECAVHMEAGGVVKFCFRGEWLTSWNDPAAFRDPTRTLGLTSYRLVYSTPVGMSPVIGAPGHAYGLAKDAPEGWEAAMYAEGWVVGEGCQPNSIIEARPPAPAPEPRTEKVPLTKLAGRTLVGETEPVEWIRWARGEWRWGPVRVFAPANNNTLILTVDVDSGMVEVLAEEEA